MKEPASIAMSGCERWTPCTLGNGIRWYAPRCKAARALKLSTVVENAGNAAESCRVRWQILDAAGKTVSTAESPVAEVAADGKQSFSAIAKLAHPALWSPEEPNLYYAVATVETGGKMRDRDQATFGVRTLAFDAEQGFF